MDELQQYELDMLMKNENLEISQKQEWERVRMLMYASELHVLKKHTKPTDILHLPWDKTNDKQEGKTDLHFTDAQISAYKKMLQERNKKNKQ